MPADVHPSFGGTFDDAEFVRVVDLLHSPWSRLKRVLLVMGDEVRVVEERGNIERVAKYDELEGVILQDADIQVGLRKETRPQLLLKLKKPPDMLLHLLRDKRNMQPAPTDLVDALQKAYSAATGKELPFTKRAEKKTLDEETRFMAKDPEPEPEPEPEAPKVEQPPPPKSPAASVRTPTVKSPSVASSATARSREKPPPPPSSSTSSSSSSSKARSPAQTERQPSVASAKTPSKAPTVHSASSSSSSSSSSSASVAPVPVPGTPSVRSEVGSVRSAVSAASSRCRAETLAPIAAARGTLRTSYIRALDETATRAAGQGGAPGTQWLQDRGVLLWTASAPQEEGDGELVAKAVAAWQGDPNTSPQLSHPAASGAAVAISADRKTVAAAFDDIPPPPRTPSVKASSKPPPSTPPAPAPPQPPSLSTPPPAPKPKPKAKGRRRATKHPEVLDLEGQLLAVKRQLARTNEEVADLRQQIAQRQQELQGKAKVEQLEWDVTNAAQRLADQEAALLDKNRAIAMLETQQRGKWGELGSEGPAFAAEVSEVRGLRGKLECHDAQIDELQAALRAAQEAIIASAEQGYEKDLKLHIARKTLEKLAGQKLRKSHHSRRYRNCEPEREVIQHVVPVVPLDGCAIYPRLKGDSTDGMSPVPSPRTVAHSPRRGGHVSPPRGENKPCINYKADSRLPQGFALS